MLSSASGFRRTGAGLALIIAPLLFLVADVLSPAWSDDSAEYFAEVALVGLPATSAAMAGSRRSRSSN